MNDVWYFIQKYLDIYSFFIPLGIIGSWRWTIWLIKRLIAERYRPITNHYKTSVSIITPVYNENPKHFIAALNSWIKNNPQEIIAVIDYSDKDCIKICKEYKKKYPHLLKLIVTKTPGKRPALADGIQSAKSAIVALVDSDTVWKPDVLLNSIRPFKDKKIAGVATRQSVVNPKTLSERLFNLQLNQRFFDDMPFLHVVGNTLTCLSGRTAFYRKSILLPLLPQLVNEYFLGHQVISGEDKRLTYLVEAQGWKVAYQDSAHVLTYGTSEISTFLNQKIRWARNSWRADFGALKNGWVWRNKLFALYLLDRVIQPFTLLLSPLYFIVSILLQLWVPVIAILLWWHISRGIKIYPHLKKHPKDVLILPHYVAFNLFSSVIRLYALFTLHVQGWITRWDKSRLPQFQFVRLLPGYIITTTVILFLLGGVYIYKEQNYIKPQLEQKALLSKMLPEKTNLQEIKIKNIRDTSTDINNLQVVKRHEIGAGESLGSVASQYGIDIYNLLYANISRLPNWNNLDPGFVLNVPSKDIQINAPTNFSYTRLNSDFLQVAYNQQLNTIDVYGRANTIALSDIAQRVDPSYLKEVSPKVWELGATIAIHSGVTLVLDKKELEWLRLISNKQKYVMLFGQNATILIDGVKITSWDDEKNDYDHNLDDGRSFVLVKDGSRMDILNSELAYLGFSRTPDLTVSPYGVSWRMSNGKLGTTILTGIVEKSTFHHNYFGAYTFGATGMVWRGNEFHSNIRYGLDPHDDSNGFLVENNVTHDNGTHGIIFSRRCVNNIIRNNISYNNNLHGIMLHEESNNNVVENNIVYGNRDGIALWHSSQNVVRNNTVYNNERGIRANADSSENNIENNKIKNNSQYGIYLYSHAEKNIVARNVLEENSIGIYTRTSENHIANNTLTNNTIGIYLLGDSTNNTIVKNTITYSKLYGIYSKVRTNSKNFRGENSLRRNRNDYFVRVYSQPTARLLN